MLNLTVSTLALAAALAQGGDDAAEATPPHDPARYLGEIRPFGFNFCPKGWASAEGQILPIAQNTALFSLYGTTYGGDGRTTFGIPDLRGRMAMGTGTGYGVPTSLGQQQGQAMVTLTSANLAQHTHFFLASDSPPNTRSLAGSGFASFPSSSAAYATSGPLQLTMNPNMIRPVGAVNPRPFDIRQPQLAIRYCAALTGLFPSRN